MIGEALRKLQAARAAEGKAMADELQALGAKITDHLSAIEARAPEVVAAYQKRLGERVQALVGDQGCERRPRAPDP